MDRRTFIAVSAAAGTGVAVLGSNFCFCDAMDSFAARPPVFSITPVVGDGKWIWTAPPEGQRGYLEARPFQLSIGIELQGKGNASGIMASTPVPLQLPEQKVDNVQIKTEGCTAEIRKLAPEAGQLLLTAEGIEKGQKVLAEAVYKLTLFKQYQGYEKEQFPAKTKAIPKELRRYLGASPGIQTHDKAVKDLAAQVGGQLTHPWDKALAFHEWVWQNIKGRIGAYTNVLTALKDRVGDCEERAAVFIALCRASDIPARLVWVPNHNWAEFYLTDEQGDGHWIPAHTAGYSWFGWTGAHELVLQKGDSIRIPELPKPQRVLEDWMRRSGTKPDARYFADLKPLPPETDATSDAGPGERSKSKSGEWLRGGKYAAEKFVRR